MNELTVELPHNWEPRDYQRPAFKYLQNGGKRALLIWHRRSGKDDLALHFEACAVMQKPATYWHMLPQAAQARKAIWEAVNPHTGIRRIDEAFPHELRDVTREQEMMIRFKNGSTWQVVGSDNYNSLVGSPPYGVVFSEWAINDPTSWGYIRPILLENGGWALFISTPRGKNHMKRMYDGAKDDPEWYVEILTAEDTGLFTPEQLERERSELQREYGHELGNSLFEQEYYCSFAAANIGAFFAKEMQAVERAGKILPVPYDPQYPVYTGWDIGKNMHMAIWCFQVIGMEYRAINFFTNLRDINEAVRTLQDTGYMFGGHYLPHDAEPAQVTTGYSVEQQVQQLGLTNTHIVPMVKSVGERINAIRRMIPMTVFDKTNTEYGVDALNAYGVEWDEKHKTLKENPKHDWSSHPCDAFGTFAMGYQPDQGTFDYKAFYA